MNDNTNLLNQYDYQLPPELIANKPVNPRDKARLLVFNKDNKHIEHDTFLNLEKYLPKNAVIIFNQTRVIPARLPLYKETGGKIEVLYIGRNKNSIQVLASKKLILGSKIFLISSKKTSEQFLVVKKTQGIYELKPNFPLSKFNFFLKKFGLTPLPPYMKNSPLSEKERREAYQTFFAKKGESVAAPTASLHFTKRLINKIKNKGISVKFVRLDVNLGTFAPLTKQQIKTKKLHKENYFIDPKTAKFILKAKKNNRPIIAVGTTVVRVLESYAKTKKLTGGTDLFILPGFKFKIINGMITNFHVPKSSLLMLVASLIDRENLFFVYKNAINNNFRFFSFGDGMLII